MVSPRVLVVGLILVLAGCSTGWVKADASASDFRRDSYECERDARMAGWSFGRGVAGALNMAAFAAQCLEARGWHQR